MEDITKVNNDDQSKFKEESIQQETNQSNFPQEWRIHHDHPIDKVICDISQGVTTRLNLKDVCLNMTFISQIEPSKVDEAIEDDLDTFDARRIKSIRKESSLGTCS